MEKATASCVHQSWTLTAAMCSYFALGTRKIGTFLHSHTPASLRNAKQPKLRMRFHSSRATGVTPGSPHTENFFFFSNDSPLTFQTPVQPKPAKNSPRALHLIFILQQRSLFPAAFLPFWQVLGCLTSPGVTPCTDGDGKCWIPARSLKAIKGC